MTKKIKGITVTLKKEMLVWHDSQMGLYKSLLGYVLVEYKTGDARYMDSWQAKDWKRRMSLNT